MAVIVCQLPDGEELVRFVRTGAEDRDPRRRGLDRGPDGIPIESRAWRGDERRMSAMKRYPQNDWDQSRRPAPDPDKGPDANTASTPQQRRPNDRPGRAPESEPDAPSRRRQSRNEDI
jgi:hypothetical protein